MSTQLVDPKPLQSVLDFHTLFTLFVGETPAIPAPDVCDLRVNLLQEEVDELKEAIAAGDLVEIADALTDIQYVLSGAVLAFGMGDIFAELFEEVQYSNMSKACETREEAEETIEYYKTERGMLGYIVEKDDVFLVLREGDNKVLKSVNYKPANIKAIIEKSTP